MTKTIRMAFALVATMAVLLASQAVALAGTHNDGFVSGPDERREARETGPFATLHPAEGNEVRFVEIHDASGNVTGVGIIETLEAGQTSKAQVEPLRGANPMEVFNALSLRNTPIPQILEEIYGPPQLGPQGWGEPQADVTGVELETDVSFTPPKIHNTYPRKTGCLTRYGSYPASFVAPLEYGLETFSDYFLSKYNGPLAKPNDWHVAANQPAYSGSAPYHDFYGRANRATAFSTAVMLCDTAFFHNVNGVPVGKDVVLYTRPFDESTSGPWLNVYDLGKLDAVDKVISFEFHPPEPVSPFAPEFDFRLEIENASAATSQSGPGTKGDLYHIGAAWQVNTTGDFPADD